AWDILVDLHGQHEHQSLLHSETHIELLDEFADLGPQLERFSLSYGKAASTLAKLDELRAREQQLRDRRSLYEFQMKEIDAVDPRTGEEQELEAERVILENAE